MDFIDIDLSLLYYPPISIFLIAVLLAAFFILTLVRIVIAKKRPECKKTLLVLMISRDVVLVLFGAWLIFYIYKILLD